MLKNAKLGVSAIAAFMIFAGQAHGESNDPVIWAAVQSIAQQVSEQSKLSVTVEQQQQLANALEERGYQMQADPIAYFGRLVSESLTGPLMPAGVAIEALQPKLKQFLTRRNGDAGLSFGQLALPYMIEEGLCRGEVSSAEGLTCAFVYGDNGVDFHAVLGRNSIVPAVAENGVLARVLSRVFVGGASIEGIYDDNGDGMKTGDVEYAYLGNLKIRGEYGVYYQYQIHCASACRASAAGYGAINGQYLATGSDMVFAIASAGLYCDFFCSIGTALEAAQGKDAIDYALRHGDKRYGLVHNSTKVAHLLATGCGAAPAPYWASPLYNALKNKSYDLPYDTGVVAQFGTYYQKPYALTSAGGGLAPVVASALTPSMYPTPSGGAVAFNKGNGYGLLSAGQENIAMPYWYYEFTKIEGWRFNIIFAAVENADVLQQCDLRITQESILPTGWGGNFPVARGNQFWMMHADGATGDFDLPRVRLIIGFNGGHLPIELQN